MKLKLPLMIFILISCSINRDLRSKHKTNNFKLSSSNQNLNRHFINGNYVISVSDSMDVNLKNRIVLLNGARAEKNDTINLTFVNEIFVKHAILRLLRERIEKNEAAIFSISESKYIYKLKRTVSKTKYNQIHTFYIYKNPLNEDTILDSYSFDSGCPSF